MIHLDPLQWQFEQLKLKFGPDLEKEFINLLNFKAGEKRMETTPYQVAKNFIGLKEIPGIVNNPLIVAMHQIDNPAIEDESVPWCSSFVNFIFFCLGLIRTKSARARSWLQIGEEITLDDADHGFDVVILKRGKGNQPGPETINAPGHVGFYVRHDDKNVWLLGGNQGDQVSIAQFPVTSILGIRRVKREA